MLNYVYHRGEGICVWYSRQFLPSVRLMYREYDYVFVGRLLACRISVQGKIQLELGGEREAVEIPHGGLPLDGYRA